MDVTHVHAYLDRPGAYKADERERERDGNKPLQIMNFKKDLHTRTCLCIP